MMSEATSSAALRATSGSGALGVLVGLVGAQHRDGSTVQRDGPLAAGRAALSMRM